MGWMGYYFRIDFYQLTKNPSKVERQALGPSFIDLIPRSHKDDDHDEKAANWIQAGATWQVIDTKIANSGLHHAPDPFKMPRPIWILSYNDDYKTLAWFKYIFKYMLGVANNIFSVKIPRIQLAIDLITLCFL